MNIGNWQLDTIHGGDFSIDGGAVYGVVPKTVWGRISPCDESNRVRLRNNCVLARDGDRNILIDSGYGGKYSPLDRNAYALERGNPVVESLQSLGIASEEIDVVILSHLHFDHAGGIASRDERGGLHLTFSRARHIVGRFEWEDACSQRPELAPAYPQDNLEPLRRSALLELVDDGATIVPGLRIIRTGGHTRGHLALLLESGGEAALYLGDICPTTQHVRQLWCLSYDTFLLITRQKKRQLLEEAAERRWWLLWTHDPAAAASRVVATRKREFDVIDARHTL